MFFCIAGMYYGMTLKNNLHFYFKLMIEVFLLSLVQGITEFIPVSSSSHLFLLSGFMDYKNQSLSIDVSLHIGSFIVVITYLIKI